jgi:adenylate cyclase, class 2
VNGHTGPDRRPAAAVAKLPLTGRCSGARAGLPIPPCSRARAQTPPCRPARVLRALTLEDLMRNIELKAKYKPLTQAHAICHHLDCEDKGCEEQTDTYFRVPHGRLKLRECSLSGNRLIYYHRLDDSGPRASDFHLVPLDENAVSLRELLLQVLPELVTIRKRRHLYLLGPLRIHLDEVHNLGSFVEFEYVVSGSADDETGLRIVHSMIERFHIRNENIVPQSYSDLLLTLEGERS